MPSDTPTQPPQGKEASDFGVEIITPLEVHQGNDQPDSDRSFRITSITVLLLLIILTSMVTGGLFLIRHLSKHPVNLAKNTEHTESSETGILKKQDLNVPKTNKERVGTTTEPVFVPLERQPAIKSMQTVDTAKFEREKETADKELAKLLKLKNEIEEKEGSVWGGEEYETMTALSEEGDRLLLDRSFSAAAEKYAQAANIAKELISNTGTVFQKLTDEGQKALENGDSVIAQQKFSTALKIQPSDESARRNLERAKKLDEVNRLVKSGKNHEENNRFAFAHADFQRALQLDPESREAQNGLIRMKEKIVDEQFQKLMSDGLTAYHNGHYQLARTTLLKAKSFQPQSREVKSALLQVDEAIRLDKIEKLRQKSMSAEQAENWEQALKSYLTVLKIDPNISFAVQGKKRSLEHIQVAKRIAFFLEKPDVMESDRQLENAIRLIEEAEKLEQRGTHLNARLNELKTLVDIAGTPVKVIIESDNLTEIAVYKIGKLGKFTFRELSLRPGTYTVVGSRNGYQDVRLKITVKPGQTSLRVSIICNIKV
jgi:Flp pilus assembly protein TadD